MKVVSREIQHVITGKWEELESIDKKFAAVERRLGYPQTKKRYRCLFGAHDLMSTLIIEYSWESLSEMEQIFEKARLDDERSALADKLVSILSSNQMEVYIPLP